MVEDAGGLELYRYEAESITESIQIAHAHLQQHLGPSARGALVVDGYLHVGDTRGDALEVELLGPGAVTLGTVRQQYRPERSRVRSSTLMVHACSIDLKDRLRRIPGSASGSMIRALECRRWPAR